MEKCHNGKQNGKYKTNKKNRGRPRKEWIDDVNERMAG